MEKEIFGIFPTPIGYYKRKSDLSSKEISFVENLSYDDLNVSNARITQHSKKSPNGTDRLNILEDSQMADIREFCQDCVNDFVINTYKVHTKFKIVTSWANRTSPGAFHKLHNHANSILSGVFYFQDLDKGPIRFYNSNSGLMNSCIDLGKSERDNRTELELESNQFNSKHFYLNCSKNSCIIFPSTLMHEVVANWDEKNRYSIAFNCWLEPNQDIGSIGLLTHMSV
jgi:uncharacterized protein (TIGR02466 family)